MSLIDYILLGLVGAALGFAFGLWRKNRKAGKTCSGNCAGCSQNCSGF